MSPKGNSGHPGVLECWPSSPAPGQTMAEAGGEVWLNAPGWALGEGNARLVLPLSLPAWEAWRITSSLSAPLFSGK